MVNETGNLRGNRVLSYLAAADFALLEKNLRPVTLRFRQCLEAANRRIKAAYFPYRGLASVVAVSSNRSHQAEVGVVGREGMTGLSLLLGAEQSPCDVFMQIEGDGMSIAASDLRQAMDESLSLRMALLRYAQVFAIQAGQTALANARGKVEQRLARWLLMAHDRLSSDDLRLTHEFLAVMLGVRRAGVTTALHELEQQGFISTERGSIRIADRGGLEECADGLYGVPERELERLIPVR
jgi:CRP-like cAMP-binding protein